MLAGQAPFAGSLAQVMSQHLHKPPPLEKLQNLPECVRTVVGHMIEKDPAKRPQTPAALRGELENCLALIEAAPPAGEQDFPTMVEATTVPRAVEPPAAQFP
jgi:serine/threonine protein kinase